MVVVGGIYSPNHYFSRWLGFRSMSTPDSPVRTRHPTFHCPMSATSVVRWNRLLDSSAPVAHRTVRYDLIIADCFRLLTFMVRGSHVAVDRWRRWPLVVGSPDSSVNFSHGALRFLESGLFIWRSSLAPDTVRCTTGWCNPVLPHTYRIGPRVIFLICIYELYAFEKRSTRQTC
jgi:hypothetical protein